MTSIFCGNSIFLIVGTFTFTLFKRQTFDLTILIKTEVPKHCTNYYKLINLTNLLSFDSTPLLVVHQFSLIVGISAFDSLKGTQIVSSSRFANY